MNTGRTYVAQSPSNGCLTIISGDMKSHALKASTGKVLGSWEECRVEIVLTTFESRCHGERIH